MTPENQIMNHGGIIKVLWLAMLASPAGLYLMLVIMDHLNVTRTASMASAGYLLYAGAALVPIAVYMLRSYKNANRTLLEKLKREPDNAARLQTGFLQQLIIGMAVADAPAAIAFVYYFLSGDADKAALLVMSSLILCYLFKPTLPVRRY